MLVEVLQRLHEFGDELDIRKAGEESRDPWHHAILAHSAAHSDREGAAQLGTSRAEMLLDILQFICDPARDLVVTLTVRGQRYPARAPIKKHDTEGSLQRRDELRNCRSAHVK